MAISFFNTICNLIFPCLNIITNGVSNDCLSSYKDELSYSSDVSELPDSVTLEILLKLPIKTIVQCRCVCKSWYNLTYESYFAQAYYTNPPFTSIAFNYGNHFNFLEIGASCDVIHTRFNPKATALPKARTSNIRGSCHGLLCVVQCPYTTEYSDYNASYNEQAVYIINPMRPEVISLPPVEKAKRMTSDVVYAFGCSANTGLYKVVRIVTSWYGDQDDYQTHGEIVTIGVDEEWRILEDPSFPFSLSPCGVNLNGTVYLVGEDFNTDNEDDDDDDDSVIGFILAFDIAEEKGQRIMLPPGTADRRPSSIKLAVCDDKLCFTDNGNEGRVDIWMMKDDGVVQSWSKEIVKKTWIPADLRHSEIIPVATLRNEDLLMSWVGENATLPYPGHLIRFDRRNMMMSNRLEVSCSVFSPTFLFGYVPSFFSRIS